MKRTIIGIVGLSLTACGAVAAQQYNMGKVQSDFIACMNATAAPATQFGLSAKIDGCQHAAWSLAYATVQR